MQYRMTGLPAAEAGACPAATDDAAPDIVGATRARLTYLDAGTSALRCDVVLALDGAPTAISVPRADEPVDLVVEYLDDAGAVLGRGVTRDVALDDVGTVDVRIAPTDTFACAPRRAAAGRAFHTATVLPDGEVLLLGGIAGPDGDEAIEPATGLFLQARAEIYTPSTGALRTIAIPGLVPRAFHQAYVIDTGGDDATIAVIGGITVTGDPATTPVAVVGTKYRIEPSGAALGAPGELLHYDSSASTFTREAVDATGEVEARGFGALVAPGAAIIGYVGGVDLELPARPAKTSADAVDPANGLRTSTVATRRGRVGATANALDADTVLVWGGDPTAGVTGQTPELGERFTAWSSAPAASALTLDPSSDVGPHRAFHAAARAGDGALIFGGGFQMDQGNALTPVVATLQRLDGTTLLLQTLADLGAGATPAGYGAAATVPDGDVLLAGGNPDATALGCSTADQSLICSIPDAWRYDSATALAARTGDLGVPRYAHALTLLADGTVLVSGGLTPSGTGLRAVTDLELYESRGLADDPLLPAIDRDPGDVARTTSGAPLAPCTVVVEYADAQMN